jgi:hypothetical protein
MADTVETVGGLGVVHHLELEAWLRRAHRDWSPIMAAGRTFNALIGERAEAPGLADYDVLFEVAHLAVQWLEDNPCPDGAVGRRFRAQMMGYRAVADTVRSAMAEADGDLIVARLGHLRGANQHAQAIDAASVGSLVRRASTVSEGGRIEHFRRRVPR